MSDTTTWSVPLFQALERADSHKLSTVAVPTKELRLLLEAWQSERRIATTLTIERTKAAEVKDEAIRVARSALGSLAALRDLAESSRIAASQRHTPPSP